MFEKLQYWKKAFHNFPGKRIFTKIMSAAINNNNEDDFTEDTEELCVKNVNVSEINEDKAMNGHKRKFLSQDDENSTQNKRSKGSSDNPKNGTECSSSLDQSKAEEKKSETEDTENSEGGSSSHEKKLIEVKIEPEELHDEEASSSTRTSDIKTSVKVEKADASSTSRESCKYGIRCYRRNPMHRIEEAHPGDHDYKRPQYPPPPDNVPDCPYGNLCYRRNPIHFQSHKHPDDTDFQRNYRTYRLRQRNRLQQQNNINSQNIGDENDDSDLDEYDVEDPFINDDSDLDYVPSEEEDYTEEFDIGNVDKE